MEKFLDLILKENIQYKISEFHANEIIFYESQDCEYVSFIIDGAIYMSTLYNDNFIDFNFMSKDEFFGNNLLFSKEHTYNANIIALTDVKLLNIDKANFSKSLQNPNILLKYIELLSTQIIKDKQEIKLLKVDNLKDRLYYLFHLCNGKIENITITNLAKRLNAKRETLSRIIKKEILNGKIKKEGTKTLIQLK